jgi:hypothetical protein
MDELTLAVVGIDFPNNDKAKSNRLFELLQCLRGEPVELRLEPKNKHDPHAIAVFSLRGVQVGYLTAERAPWVGARLKRGEEAIAVFQQLEQAAAYIRVRFGGGVPTLPPERAAASPAPQTPRQAPSRSRDLDPDVFYPDPPAPEWGA